MTRHPVPAGDLARLLDTEHQLGERLRSARAEADVLVAHARAAAEQREAALAAELEAEQRLMGERLQRERRKREREIADAAQREVEAYQRVSNQRLAEIGRALAPRLLDDEGGP
jgi:vacuolar-type H+-ATPase subunit H